MLILCRQVCSDINRHAYRCVIAVAFYTYGSLKGVIYRVLCQGDLQLRVSILRVNARLENVIAAAAGRRN